MTEVEYAAAWVPDDDPHRGWEAAAALAVDWLMGGLLFLPRLPSFLFQLAHTGTPWGESAGLSAALESVGEWAGASWSGGKPRPLALLLVLLGLLGAGAARVVGYQVEFDLRGRPPGRALAIVTGGTLLLGLVIGKLTGGSLRRKIHQLGLSAVPAAGHRRAVTAAPSGAGGDPGARRASRVRWFDPEPREDRQDTSRGCCGCPARRSSTG
ncbi:hypothetical protein [Geodermatophilus chilensis]|uniref:hypothetical protein n=1 Tax=Geodermatophilus chilensis TaxID=2035835 RepID=UPI0012FFFB02|nr:hypothetical protein [Geodermatophilus chilensis]